MVVKNLLGVSLKNNKDVIGIYIILSFYRLYNTLLVLTIICRGITVYEIDVFTFIIAYYLSVALRLRTTTVLPLMFTPSSVFSGRNLRRVRVITL